MVSIIIPIHVFTEKDKTLLQKAIDSVKAQETCVNELIIVYPSISKIGDQLKTMDYGDLKFSIIESEKIGYSNQVNYAVSKIESEFFSVLEYDDEFSKIWVKNFVLYKNEFNDVDMFMPITLESNMDNKFLGFSNEIVWAYGYSKEMGYVEHDLLLKQSNFNVSGSIISKSKFLEVGGFKSNIKYTFSLEFLLRFTYYNGKVIVIPRMAYRHVNDREGSLFNEFKESLSENEIKFQIGLVRKEFFFKEDREIIYVEEEAPEESNTSNG